MGKQETGDTAWSLQQRTVLVGVDFSECSRSAFNKAREWLNGYRGRIVVLHVIDKSFTDKCIQHKLGTEAQIKKSLFLEAKAKLKEFLDLEPAAEVPVEVLVCEGVPFMEINKKALEYQADLIVIGRCGRAADMDTLFFGSTAERVLRFITRPVLCVPPDTEYRRG
ncbi:MAG: universal stress protein [Deltaproteobacteria bacterium]|nr:universal stress protein [Deltaproteobacteria bacterium]MBW2152270.1 universal stress protein [Deltaproteobacteria bacterium]